MPVSNKLTRTNKLPFSEPRQLEKMMGNTCSVLPLLSPENRMPFLSYLIIKLKLEDGDGLLFKTQPILRGRIGFISGQLARSILTSDRYFTPVV